MASTAPAAAAVVPAEFERMMAAAGIGKGEMNRIVMDYLVVEGYKDAAGCFERESGEQPGADLSTVESRMKIRQALQKGDVQLAVEMTNDVNPETLDLNKRLFFKLQLQKMVELVRQDRLADALQYAESELAELSEQDPAMLDELEEVMALFAFSNKETSPVAHLLETAQRHTVASELNAAILASQAESTTPRLLNLLRLLHWAEKNLSDRCTVPTFEL